MPNPEPSPNPAKKPVFGTAYRGYNKAEVDQQIERLTTEMATIARQRDEAVESVAELTKSLAYTQKELTEAKAALARRAEDPSGPAAMSERVKAMMQLAEEEIAEHKAKAEEDANATREAAEAYADKTRKKAEETAAQLAEEAKAERERLDAEAADRRAEAERKSAEAIAKAEKESADKIAEAERKFAEEIAAKKAQAEKEVAELHADAKARTDAMLADAEARLADATKQQKAAVEFRKKVSERLSATYSALQEAVDTLGDMPDFDGGPDKVKSSSNGSGSKVKQPA